MSRQMRVAVASRSFSRHPILRSELLSRYRSVKFNDEGRNLKGEELVAFLRGHEGAITGLEIISDEILARLPELRVLSKYGVGTDMIDLVALRKRRVFFGWLPGVNRRSVAELTLCLMISALRKVIEANREVVAGRWQQLVGGQLSGKTVGIVGCGNVGQDLAGLLVPFDCPLLVNDIANRNDFCKQLGARQVSLDELLAQSDVVSIHLPLDKTTEMLFSETVLSRMKRTAVIVNVARGGIVDEGALKKMLIEKRIAAAAFDVFRTEPPLDRELLGLPNFLATPHIGGSAEEAILAMGRAAIDGLESLALPIGQ